LSEEKRYSFSSANTFPMKILLNPEIIRDATFYNQIPMIHFQVNPTNTCNFNCEFCSCSERNKDLFLSRKQLKDLFFYGEKVGMKAMTITGGGEATTYRHWNEFMGLLWKYKIDAGLVTNGTLLNRMKYLDYMTWIRISASDLMKYNLRAIGLNLRQWLDRIQVAVQCDSQIDWAFSYVVGKKPNMSIIKELVDFANLNDFTHLRLVNDIFIADKLKKQMTRIRNHLERTGIDDDLVNYQDRSEWTHGNEPCYLSMLKPVIGADGHIYPCCGTQYALADPTRDYERAMSMGVIEDLPSIHRNQEYFNGRICVKCYYSHYNTALNVLMKGLKHKTFV